MTQHEITKAAPLLDASGNLTEPGWARSLLPVYCRSQIRAPKTRCDSVCEAQALPTDSAEKEVLQKIPDVLLYGLRGRGLCLRQLARHLVKGDTIYEK